MKIIHSSISLDADKLKDFLRQDLVRLFRERRQIDTNFVFTENATGLKITLPDLYKDILFDIDIVNNNEIHVIKSEHYTDDVNALTIESILNDLFMEYPGQENISAIGEK